MRIHRHINEPERPTMSWDDTWLGADRGLVRAWEIGRQKAARDPQLAQRCIAGELPVGCWKGGVERTLKQLTRWGSLHYLAEWQGLRGEHLDIDPGEERTIVCSRTAMIVTFTSDLAKLDNQGNEHVEEGAINGPAPGISQQSLLSPSAH